MPVPRNRKSSQKSKTAPYPQSTNNSPTQERKLQKLNGKQALDRAKNQSNSINLNKNFNAISEKFTQSTGDKLYPSQRICLRQLVIKAKNKRYNLSEQNEEVINMLVGELKTIERGSLKNNADRIFEKIEQKRIPPKPVQPNSVPVSQGTQNSPANSQPSMSPVRASYQSDSNDAKISLNALINEYIDKEGVVLSVPQMDCIRAIDDMATKKSYKLSDQCDAARNYLFGEIKKIGQDKEPKKPDEIFRELEHIIRTDQEQLNKMASSFGSSNKQAFHERRDRSLMEDTDMIQLMPKSTPSVAVIDPLLISSKENWDPFIETIQDQLNNEKIKNVIIPVVSGNHWRGLFLSKPEQLGKPYQLEIYDSLGQKSGNRIIEDAQKLLTNSGINKSDLHITVSKEKVQLDGYSCGDFVCAKSREYMQQKGVSLQASENTLVEALKNGNINDALRSAFCDYARGHVEKTQGSLPMSSSVPASSIDASFSSMESPPLTQPRALTPDEVNKVYEKLLRSSEKFGSGNSKEISDKFKNHLKGLAEKQSKIVDQANKIGTPKNDKELAVKLQAEEFEAIGIKPK